MESLRRHLFGVMKKWAIALQHRALIKKQTCRGVGEKNRTFRSALRNAAARTLLQLVRTAVLVGNETQEIYRERTRSPNLTHNSTTYFYNKHIRVPCICRFSPTTRHAQVLDEPAADQSDATVLELQLRAISKKQHGDVAVRCDRHHR